ncbi:uncharacterized protein LOC130893013 [Diorhabda carinulata]|uniref:uncharacterized protein LOC130893013 n=1 Tax=Diorhabda carinulata TaxID=1163345 RepID=UPI0025A082C3|nr:uncharacterized protein LOC130893013 [Diorhabda carinulata]
MHLQTVLDNLSNWSNTNGLKFSETKTKCILFSRNVLSGEKPILILNGQNLEFVEYIKFLGITFDKKLTWKQHIDYLKKVCQNGLNLLKTIASHKWGADYKALIRSRIDYGSIVYASCEKTYLKQLDVLENTALRIATGALRTTPIESLHCLTGEPPLRLRRMQLSITYATSVLSNRNNPVNYNIKTDRFKNLFGNKQTTIPFYERIRQYTNILTIELPVFFPINIKTPPPWIIPIPTINVNLSYNKKEETNHPLIVQSFRTLVEENLKEYHLMYTDASKTPNGIGAAVILANENFAFKLSPHNSVHTGELYAIFQALTIASRYEYKKIAVITDSMSSINTIKQLFPKHPLGSLIKTQLYLLHQSKACVQIIWVPSHTNIPGNEKADQYAREAADNNKVTIVREVIVSDFKAVIKAKAQCKWQSEWNRSQSILKTIKPYVKPWKGSPKSRADQIKIDRLRLGHTKATHSHLFNRENPPICETCNENLNVEHLLLNCRKVYQRKIAASIRSGARANEIYHPNWFAFGAMNAFLRDTYAPQEANDVFREISKLIEENELEHELLTLIPILTPVIPQTFTFDKNVDTDPETQPGSSKRTKID